MVKIVEFINDNQLDFDPIEDVMVFMKNDPIFYRKSFFPAISKIADYHRAGKKVDPNKALGPMIDTGCNSYCKKFNLGKGPADIFTANDRQNLISRVYSEELQNIKKGEY